MDSQDLMKNLNTNPVFNPSSKLFKCIGAEINNIPTDFVWADFENCLLLIVTQYKKIGSLVAVEKGEFVSPLDIESKLYDIKTLLGASYIENELVGRFLVEKLKISKPLYLFSNLKDYGVDSLKAVQDVFIDVLKPNN